jgi:serine/threonine protein kinase
MYLSRNTIAKLQKAVDRPDLIGTRYTMSRHIARGGMGEIYLVEDTSLGRQLAMKVLDTTIDSEEFSARLRREAHIVAKLEHPGIVPVHDIGELPDGRLYYTMKYVQGARLDDYVTPSMSMTDRLRIFQKICEPVAFAHSKLIIHRDLKPQNIMIGSFGEVLVVDWGIAKAVHEDTVVGGIKSASSSNGVSTMHGTVVGTPAYMSPEQQRGEIDAMDQRTDIYSLGAVLFFLISGSYPEPIVDAQLLRRKRSRIPKSIAAVCLKALSPSPEDRYDSVIALSEDISRFLDGKPVTAYRENVLERIERWVGRNRFLVLLILAYLVMRIILLFTSGR